MAIEIRRVTSADEISAVQRQRYAIYIEELGYANPNAANGERTVADALDETGHILGAFDGGTLAGSVRINYGEFGEYAALGCVRQFGPYFPGRMKLITKLVIAPEYRAGTLMGRMGTAIYLHTIRTHPQTLFGLVACVPAHLGFFQRFGFREIGAGFAHSAAGFSHPLVAAMYDQHHFRRIGCPLVKLCPYHDAASSDWFSRTFPARAEAIPCTSN